MTQLESSLDTIQQMRLDIAPGASGWNPPNVSETTSLRQLAFDAQVTIGVVDPTEQFWVDVRNVVVDRITRQMAPGFTSQADVENSANRGQINSAMIAAETFFINQIADEQAP